MDMIKYFLCFALMVSLAYSQADRCSQFQSRADRYLKKMLFIGEQPHIPRNESAVVNYCKQVRKGFTMVKRYQTCLKPFPQQVLALILKGAKDSAKYVCDDKTHRKEVINYLECLHDGNMDKAYQFVRRGLNVLDYIGYNITDDHMLFPYICCSYHFVTDRVRQFIGRECPNKAEGAEKLLQIVVNIAAKDIIDIGCAKSPSLKHCEDKHPDVIKNIKAARLLKSPRLENRSFVKPILAIADRLSPPEDLRRRTRSLIPEN